MPRIKCHYLDCAFLDEGFCSAGMVEIDPDIGCKTYTANAEDISAEDWDEDEEELEEWEELEEDGDDDWNELDYDDDN